MECKDKFKIMSDDGGIQVLIETLWNVKSCCLDHLKGVVIVLIETLWNVKLA